MSALLAQAQQVQQKLMEAQEQLANAEVHGQAGGGLVQVTVKGSGEVVGVSIDPKGRALYVGVGNSASARRARSASRFTCCPSNRPTSTG